MNVAIDVQAPPYDFSALQRAEIAEMVVAKWNEAFLRDFSALQRAEIAEIDTTIPNGYAFQISVLFNEPKLLKLDNSRYELMTREFQCSSTSRNC